MFSKLFLMRSNVNKPLGILPPLTPPEDRGGIRVLLFLILASSAFAQSFPPDSVWTFAFDDGGDEYFYDGVYADTGYVICGESRAYMAASGQALLVKCTREGEIVWSRVLGAERPRRFRTIKPLFTDFILTGFELWGEYLEPSGRVDGIFYSELDVHGTNEVIHDINELGFAPITFALGDRLGGGLYNIVYSSRGDNDPGQVYWHRGFPNDSVAFWTIEDLSQELLVDFVHEDSDLDDGLVLGYSRELPIGDWDGFYAILNQFDGFSNFTLLGGQSNDYLFDGELLPSTDRKILVGSSASSSNGSSDLWIVGLRSDTIAWERRLGGLAREEGTSILRRDVSGTSTFLIGGIYSSTDIENEQSDFWLLELDQNGDTSYTMVLGGQESEKCEKVIHAYEGFIILGSSLSFTTPGWDACAVYVAYVADLALRPSTLNFGAVAVGDTAHRTLTLMNTGSAWLVLDEIVVSDEYFGELPVEPYVDVGDSLTVEIIFSPQTVGTTIDTLRIFSNAISGVKTVRCLGAGTAANADEESLLPTEFKLHPPYPNPFNPTTTLEFDVPKTQSVALNLYDVSGRLVRELVQQEFAAGRQRVSIDGKEMASGIYFVSMVTGEFQAAQKLVLMK